MSTPNSISFVTNSSSHLELSSNGNFPYGGFNSGNQTIPSQSLNVPGNGVLSPLVSSPMDNLANGSVTMTNQTITLPVAVDVRNTPFHHICPEQFHFITSRPTFAAAHRIISLPMLNYMMTTPEWRDEYGSELSLAKFFKDWKPMGVVKDPISAIEFARDTDNKFQDPGFTIRLVVGGRVRMTQINQASDVCTQNRGMVEKSDKLYIYATRHAWADERVDLDVGMKEAANTLYNISKSKSKEEEQKAKMQANKNEFAKYFDKAQSNRTFEGLKNNGYYWVFRPWIATDNKPPHSVLWSGYDEIEADTRWAGCCIYIGKIDHIHGKRQNDKINECRLGLYPCDNNMNHQAELLKVDKMDVMLGVQ